MEDTYYFRIKTSIKYIIFFGIILFGGFFIGFLFEPTSPDKFVCLIILGFLLIRGAYESIVSAKLVYSLTTDGIEERNILRSTKLLWENVYELVVLDNKFIHIISDNGQRMKIDVRYLDNPILFTEQLQKKVGVGKFTYKKFNSILFKKNRTN